MGERDEESYVHVAFLASSTINNGYRLHTCTGNLVTQPNLFTSIDWGGGGLDQLRATFGSASTAHAPCACCNACPVLAKGVLR